MFRTSSHQRAEVGRNLCGSHVLFLAAVGIIAGSMWPAQPAMAMAPTGFIENRGQLDPAVLYYLPGSGVTVFLTRSGPVFDIATSSADPEIPSAGRCAVRAGLPGANLSPEVVGRSPLAPRYNYFLGAREELWRTDVPSFEEVVYAGVFPGVDLSFRCDGGELTYQIEAHGVSGLARVPFDFEGADKIIPVGTGGFRLETPIASIIQTVAADGARGRFSVAYAIEGRSVPAVQKEGRLGLVWSTYLGGSGTDNGQAVVVDPWQVPLIAGYTRSTDFPATMGYDPSYNGEYDCFAARFEADGSALEWATFVGGSDSEQAHGLALVMNWFPVLTGWTRSTDFPVTPGGFDWSHNGGKDAFVVGLNQEGNYLRYSTYLGGALDDTALGLVSNGSMVYLAGRTESMDFPTTAGAYDLSYNFFVDAFVTALDLFQSPLVWSTFLGGGDDDIANGLALDGSRNVVVVGSAQSSDFPTSSGGFDQSFNGDTDAFVLKLSADGTSMLWGTYYGGAAGEQADAVDVDNEDGVVVAGRTMSSDYPVTPGSFDTTHNGSVDVVVTKLLSDGSYPAFSTFLGGTSSEQPYAVKLDSYGCPVVVGCTYSGSFPTTPDAYDQSCEGRDGFVSKLDNQGQDLLYSSYLGGSSLDEINDISLVTSGGGGDVVVTGITFSSDFPVTPGAFDEALGGSDDAFLTRLDLPGPRVWLIKPDGTGDAPTVQAGIDSAKVGDAVYLTPGTFYEHDIQLKDYVMVAGEYYGSVSAIIDAQGLGRVMSATDVDHMDLRCLALTGGRATTGGGLYLLRSDIRVIDCVITENESTGGLGAGIAVTGASPLIFGCEITNNHALGNGYGGGISCAVGSEPTISACILAGNTAFYGGGLYSASGSSPAIRSCTFCGNSDSGYGGGVAATSASASLENTIIASSAGGSAVYCGGGGSATLVCCDLYDNVGGDWTGCVASQYGTNGNISLDPRFWDMAGGDYQLRYCSPCSSDNAPGECGQIGALGVDSTRVKVWRLEADGTGDAPTIQAALDQSCEGDSILLACGTYLQSGINMMPGRVVRGETGDPECAIVQAPFGGSVFLCDGHVDATGKIEALTITGGSEGGMYCDRGSPMITDCIITGNEGNHGAGVVCLNRSAPTLLRCEITYNTATGTSAGAGVYGVDGSDLRLEECVIAHNDAASGAAVYGAGASFGGVLEVKRCTIAHNTTSTRSAALYAGAELVMDNSIVAFTIGGSAVKCGSEGSATLTCCDLYGNGGGDWVGCVEGQEGHGNISLDPLFCLGANPDSPYAIQHDSPCAAWYNPSCGQIGARGPGCYGADVDAPSGLPSVFRLYPGSPTPFRLATVLRYDLPVRTSVLIQIYDAGGRLVRRLLSSESAGPGRLSVTWDGETDQGHPVGSGVYYCRMASGSRELRQTLVRIR